MAKELTLEAAKAELEAALTQLATLEGERTALSAQVTELTEKCAKAEAIIAEQNAFIEELSAGSATAKGVLQVASSGKAKYQVNPKRRFSGIPGHGNRVFTGADLSDTTIKVAIGGREVSLVDYLEQTNASILKPVTE